MYELDNDTGGLGELDFFVNLAFEIVYELVNNIGGIGELGFFDDLQFI